MIVAVVDDVAVSEPTVLMVNVWLVAPSATVALAGTVATALLLLSRTTAPPEGAAEVSVIVPVTAVPPTTDVADNAMLDNAAVVDVGDVDEVEPDDPHAATVTHTARAMDQRVIGSRIVESSVVADHAVETRS